MSADALHVRVARAYFALQAGACVLWWAGVFAADPVRVWTLGAWNPWLLVVPDLVFFAGGSALAAARRSWQLGAVTAMWSALLTAGLLVQGLVDRAAGWGVILMTVATIGSVAATLTLRAGRMPTDWYFVGPFRFRPAPVGTRRHHVAASLGQLVAFWTGFFVVLPWLLGLLEDRLQVRWAALEAGPLPGVGLALFVLASPLGLWSCLTMAIRGEGTPLPARTARRLVIAGPYRWLRNPMATAGVLQSVGVGLWFGSWTMLAAAIAGAVAWHVAIRPVEEGDLAARFADPYERYRAVVRCWVPSPRR